jgi:hypothetical protein
MNELRRLEAMTALILFSFLLALAAGLVATGHPRMLAGLVVGALVGLGNLAWMVGTARRLVGSHPSLRSLQAVAAIRFFLVAGLFGLVLVAGRVDPVGAVIGYGCFPIAAAVAGWRIMHAQPRIVV